MNNQGVVVFTDSRGVKLGEYLDTMTQYAHVEVIRGAGISDLSDPITEYVKKELPDAVYVLAGINDCTVLDRENRIVSLSDPDPVNLASTLDAKYRHLISTVRGEVTGVPVIICSLYGIDLNVYNRTAGGGIHIHQNLINLAIEFTNSKIVQINREYRVYTPRISNVIHRWHSRKHCLEHLYHRLADGLHPCDDSQVKIARNLANCMIDNHSAGYNKRF